MGEHLIIVSEAMPQLYYHLSRRFSGNEKVLLDRRRGERRQQARHTEGPERRRADRRRQPDSVPRTDWFVIPRETPLSDPDAVQPRATRHPETTGRPLRSVMLVTRIPLHEG
jgi:hypothetical protein